MHCVSDPFLQGPDCSRYSISLHVHPWFVHVTRQFSLLSARKTLWHGYKADRERVLKAFQSSHKKSFAVHIDTVFPLLEFLDLTFPVEGKAGTYMFPHLLRSCQAAI